jgi:hypothetical protein
VSFHGSNVDGKIGCYRPSTEERLEINDDDFSLSELSSWIRHAVSAIYGTNMSHLSVFTWFLYLLLPYVYVSLLDPHILDQDLYFYSFTVYD